MLYKKNNYQLLDEVEQNIVICFYYLREANNLRDSDKSRYLPRIEFNNCFIIHLHSFTTHLPKVQQSGRHCMITKIEENAQAQSIICSWATFLTNAHAQTIIRTQLFAGRLTNQNWEYYKVNDNECFHSWMFSPRGMKKFIFHRMEIFLPLHEWKHLLFVYIYYLYTVAN